MSLSAGNLFWAVWSLSRSQFREPRIDKAGAEDKPRWALSQVYPQFTIRIPMSGNCYECFSFNICLSSDRDNIVGNRK